MHPLRDPGLGWKFLGPATEAVARPLVADLVLPKGGGDAR